MKARLPPLSPGEGPPLTPELIKLRSAEFSRSLTFPPSPSSAAAWPVCGQRPWCSSLTERKQSPKVVGVGGEGAGPSRLDTQKAADTSSLPRGRPEAGVGVEDPGLLSGAPSWENKHAHVY